MDAGKNLVCVGDEVQPGNYPPGLFTIEELQELQRKKDPQYTRKPFTLRGFTHPAISGTLYHDTCRDPNELLYRCAAYHVHTDPAYRFVASYLKHYESASFAFNERWVLRNLTTKQIVRSEVIAPHPGYRRKGPFIEGGIGFGEVLASRICWSTSSSTDINDVTHITRGVWAGHRFDIMTRGRHDAQSNREEWSDVSYEMEAETATIWEANYGPEWCDIRHQRWKNERA
ncbi:hypothetical protein F4678DRAFT_459092 [Xylaria arbuscula]|nr:hypothetical protein F4678DRAFT_459092 [Xylaria arbuscula]